jgi:glycosyltransferase involved in cell wall biosynthesis
MSSALDGDEMKTAACTIIAKNYLPFARVLMSSLRAWAPDALRIVVLVDHPDGFFDPAREDFEVILSEALPIPDSRWFHFKYNILELSTAVKPFALEYILERYGVDQVLYFDPDIAIYSELGGLTAALRDSSVILTPHLTSPLMDARRPTDLDILRSGSYNLGFIGIRRDPETARFLEWWKARLFDQCVVDLPKGLFVDQRWIDLVPGMFGGVTILRNPGYNVAYWNLSHRTVTRSPGGHAVNGEPLCFFHFSGFNPDEPDGFSRHQNRFTLDDLGDVRELALEYRKRLYEAGYSECRKWPYAFGVFQNGFPIPDMGRPAHHEVPDVVTRISDPFSEEGFRAFVDLWNQPLVGPDGKPSVVTRLSYRIYRSRADVQQAMPDIFGGDLLRFLSWVLSSGRMEHNLSDVFVAPISNAIQTRARQETHSADAREDASPVVNEKVISTLAQSGLGVGANGVPVPVEALNDLVGGENGKLRLSKLARAIYESRPDLQRLFPDPCGRNSVRFLLWFLSFGAHEYRLAEVLLSPLREQWDAVVGSLGNPLERIWYGCVLRAAERSVEWREAGRKISRRVRFRRAGPAARLFGRGAPKAVKEIPIAAGERGIPGPRRSGELGANVVGYTKSEMGVGESVRCAARAARACGLPIAIKTVDAVGPYRLGDLSIPGEDREFPYGFNLFHVNADQAESIIRKVGPGFTRGKYNVGYWAWELEEFPDRWLPAFRFFDEIWTPSAFCQTAIASKSPIPVLRMPHAVKVECDGSVSRSDFSIPAGRFVFLTVFDLLSVSERKNPIGTIAAFRRAFGNSKDCHLVLKVSHARERPHQMAAIADAAAGLPATIINRTMDRAHVGGLIQACDCLVSLHRSEGFGLSMAEAMYLRKPVIATGYSGNTDFTKPENSFLVEYRLTRAPKGCEPYDEGAVWADPILEHAAKQMQTVFANPELCAERASRAGEYIRTHLAPEVVGNLMRERLELVASRQSPLQRAIARA